MEIPPTTTPPGRFIVLYDGHCRLCTAASQRLVRLARPGAVERLDFQQPAALDPFPDLTHDLCMQQMVLIAPDGRVFAGFEAAVRAVATRPILGWLAFLYYIPGVSQLCNLLYRLVARNRYRWFGRTAVEECESGACAVHFRRP
jgi:predicted DCC family thiol-disulfide oxidoreductase YuxK